MKRSIVIIAILTLVFAVARPVFSQEEIETDRKNTLYDILPRWLIHTPTAGTLRKGYYDLGLHLYPNGGGLVYTDIGLSSRLMLGVSYGGTNLISDRGVDWNPRIGFSAKFRVVDEMEFFPAISVGFSDQGHGKRIVDVAGKDWDRYEYKSRGFFGVASRNFYFYQWSAGWHFGVNYSLEDDEDDDNAVNFFAGLDVAFNYNLGLLFEYDMALNDNNSAIPVSGKGRGYLNMSVKWLFTANLELELIAKDLLINRPNNTFAREVRLTYINNFGN